MLYKLGITNYWNQTFKAVRFCWEFFCLFAHSSPLSHITTRFSFRCTTYCVGIESHCHGKESRNFIMPSWEGSKGSRNLPRLIKCIKCQHAQNSVPIAQRYLRKRVTRSMSLPNSRAGVARCCLQGVWRLADQNNGDFISLVVPTQITPNG